MRQKPLSRQAQIILPVFGILSIMLVWQFLLPASGVPSYIAPTPTQIFSVFQKQWPLLMSNFMPTFIEAAAGFTIGNMVAVLLAIVFSYVMSSSLSIVTFLVVVAIERRVIRYH